MTLAVATFLYVTVALFMFLVMLPIAIRGPDTPISVLGVVAVSAAWPILFLIAYGMVLDG